MAPGVLGVLAALLRADDVDAERHAGGDVFGDGTWRRAVTARIAELDLAAVVAERDATLVELLKAKAGSGLP